MSIKQFNKILVIRLSSAGDIILTTPVVEALRKTYPRAEIDFLIKEEFAPLLAANPQINNIIKLQKSENSPYRFVRFVSELRHRNYDLLVDLHKNPKTFLLRIMLSEPVHIVTEKRTIERLAFVRLKKAPNVVMRVPRLHLESLRKIGINFTDIPPKLYLTPEEESLYRRLVPPDRPVVGIHPFAHWKTKEWGYDKYAELAKAFASLNWFVIFFDKGESTRNIRYISPNGLRELMGYISRCNLFFGNDSVGVHIANAFNVPLVAIFGPTHPALGFAPEGDNVKIVYKALECSPCSLHGEKRCKKGLLCMNSITVDEVIEKGLELAIKNQSRSFH